MEQRRPEQGLRAPIRPLRIASAYALLAALWVFVSSLTDGAVLDRSPQDELLAEVIKGFVFVLATGTLLYFLLERLRRRLDATQSSLDQSLQRSEAERRRIERIARIGHWVWRPIAGETGGAGGISAYSDSAAAIFGVAPADLAIATRDYVARFVHPDDRLRMARFFSDPAQDRTGTMLAEYRIIRADGEVRTIYEVTEIVDDPSGGTRFWQGTVQDVTDIRRTEADLAKSESRFRDFAGVASQFQWELDENLRIVNYSGQPCELMPSTDAELLGHTFRELSGVNAGVPESDWKAFEALLAARQPFRDFPYTAQLATGHVEYRRASARPIFDERGQFKGWRGVSRDETKEVEARRRAQAAEELLRRAVESIPDGFAIYDESDRLVMMNSKFRESFLPGPPGDPTGKTFEELLRGAVADGFFPDATGREEQFVAERLSAHRRSGDVIVFKNRKGHWTQARDHRLPDGSTVAIRTDVSEIVERDEALRQSQTMLVNAQRIARMGSWELDLVDLADLDANPLRWSQETYRIFGLDPAQDEVSNAAFYRMVPQEDHGAVRSALQRAIAEGVPYDVEHHAIRPDGTEIVVHDMGEVIRDARSGRPVKIVGTVQDVTAIKRTEDALRQAQKMEAIGQLTGGIAHDFNNLLMVMGGNLELLSDGLEPQQQRLRRFANAALEAVTRGGQLTQRLLAFARRQKLASEPTDLNKLVASIVPLMHRTLGEQIAIETVLARETWLTMTDGSQVENAILNLAVNARDAMPDGGRLVIRTENLHLDQGWAMGSGDLPAGDYVLLSVSDNGQGMPPAVRERAFEPFFTTKEAGRGTGLGLSMVYGFVKQSGGDTKILSEIGRGTTVQLFLPRVAAAGQAADAGGKPALPGGTERILLVEDEELVRSTVATMLRGLGYDVSEASEGAVALAAIAAGPPFDLVLTDMVMPGGTSGWDLAQAVWRERPQQRFLFSTGYTDNPIFRQAHGDTRIRVLSKPYNKRTLALTLREAIELPISQELPQAERR